jgi:hypothetical protein
MRHAPDCIHFPGVRVDEFRPRLADGVPVFPELPSLQPAPVLRRGPDGLSAPAAAAYRVPDVPLRNLRVRSAGRPYGVRVNVSRADAANLRRGARPP